MALTVGELVGYLRVDDTDFTRKVDQGERRFQGLARVAGTSARTVAQVLVGATTATAALGAAAFKVGLDYNRLQQSSRAALATLLGGAEAANAQMDKLDEFARSSPFAKQVFITAQQQLLGFGVQAEKVVPTLDAIQNAVAAVGGSNEQVSQVTYALAQMQGQGKLTGETLNQLGQYGIDAASVLGKEMGKTGAEIRDMASKPGGIPVDKVWDPLVKGLMERFGGATDNIKQQFDGAADRVKGAWRDIGAVLAAPFIDPNGGGRAVDWTNQLADGMRDLEQKARPTVALLIDRFGPGLDRIVTRSLERARGAVNALDLSQLNGQLDTLGRYAPLVAGTSAALFALGTSNLPILSTLGITGINPVVAGIAALVAASPELRTAARDFFEALSPLVPVAGEVAGAAVDAAMSILDELAPALRDLLLAAAPVIVQLGTALGPALVAVLGAAEPIAGVLADILSVVAQLPTPVIVAATAFWALNAATDAVGKTVGGIPGALARVRTSAQLAGTALRTAFGPIGLILGTVASVFALFADQNEKARTRVEEFADTLDRTTGAVTDYTRELAFANLQESGYIDMAKKLGIALDDLVDASINPTGEAAGRLRGKLDEARAAMEAETSGGWTGPDAAKARDRLAELETVLGGVGLQSEALAEAQQLAQDKLAAGIGTTQGATGATQSHTDALKANADAQREAAGNAVSLREAQIRVEDGQKRLNDAVERAAELNADAEASEEDKAAALRDVESALLATVHQYNDVTDGMERNNASAADLDATIRQQRDAFIANAQQIGYTADEARDLAREYGLIPDRVHTEVLADATAARGTINTFIDEQSKREISIRVTARGEAQYRVGGPNWMQADGGVWDGKVKTFADGGMNSAGQRVARVPQIVRGGANIVWGEPETGWEAYISGKPSMRHRNLQVWAESGRRLGVPSPWLQQAAAMDAAARQLGAIRMPTFTPRADGAVTGAPPAASRSGERLVAYLTDAQVERLAVAFERGSQRGAATVLDTASSQMRYTTPGGL